MKKFLIVLVIGGFTGCNNSATSTEKSVDSSANATIDSLKETSNNNINKIDSTKIK